MIVFYLLATFAVKSPQTVAVGLNVAEACSRDNRRRGPQRGADVIGFGVQRVVKVED